MVLQKLLSKTFVTQRKEALVRKILDGPHPGGLRSPTGFQRSATVSQSVCLLLLLVAFAITCKSGSDISSSTPHKKGDAKPAFIGVLKPLHFPALPEAYATPKVVDARVLPEDLSMVSIEFKVEGSWNDFTFGSGPEKERAWSIVGFDRRADSDAVVVTLLVPRGEDHRVMVQPVDNGRPVGPGFDLIVNSVALLGTFWGVQPSPYIQFLDVFDGAEVPVGLGQNTLPIEDRSRHWVLGEERHLRVGAFVALRDGRYGFYPEGVPGVYLIDRGSLTSVEGSFQLDLAVSQRVGICPYTTVPPCSSTLLVTEE